MEIKFNVKFLGAAKIVTGSSYIIDVVEDGKSVYRFMINHGMFQGPADEQHNTDKYQFSPSDISLLVLTHAHIDHCGLIPKLVRYGYNGPILSTKQTYLLADLILHDSAKIQEKNEYNRGIPANYNTGDVNKTLSQFKIIRFNDTYFPMPELSIELIRAGHILGAASVMINYKGKSICFSGDLGRTSQDTVKDYDLKKKTADYIVIESLYGGKLHEDKNTTFQKFVTAINDTISRDGNVIIPAFAVQRTQEILATLNIAISNGAIKKNVQIFLDSPLAERATNVYTDNLYETSLSRYSNNSNLKSLILSRNVTVVKSRNMTAKVKRKKGVIIIAGSGMCNGGRILEYLKESLGNKADLLAIVGFQAEGTLGRELIEGKQEVKIDAKDYLVKIKIDQFKGFSAHADQFDLIKWLESFSSASISRIFLVHAEIEQSSAFQEILEPLTNAEIIIPGLGEEYTN